MAHKKNSGLLLKGCLLMSLLLSGCGGQALSQREIVRGVLFERQGSHYSVCLVVADQETDTNESKIVSAQGNTPAQALKYAEEALDGDAYYGLLDLAALPGSTDLSVAREIGELLYENAQPAPELSVFVLDSVPVKSWAQQGDALYRGMKELEQTYKVHCGLQQMFVQSEVCSIPGYVFARNGSYDFLLLAENAAPIRCKGTIPAQLAAILSGQTHLLKGVYANGDAACEARVQVTVEENHLQLHLRQTNISSLVPGRTEEALQTQLETELFTAFSELVQQTKAVQADPFHLDFWYDCLYGPGAVAPAPTLEVLFES